MAIDFALTSAQKKLKYGIREFAREVVLPRAERGEGGRPPESLYSDEAGV